MYSFFNIATWFLVVYVIVAVVVVVMFYLDTREIDGQMNREVCGPELPMSSIDEETTADVLLLWAHERLCKPARAFSQVICSVFNLRQWRKTETQSLPTTSSANASADEKSPSLHVHRWTMATWDTAIFLALHLTSLESCIPGIRPSVNGDRYEEKTSQIFCQPEPVIVPQSEALWPHQGAVTVENLVVRYAPSLPKALDGLNFTIPAGEKIAIVGRTGSGRNTLALSLFRFVEAASGRVVVDGKDISRLSLAEVRSKLLLVPQNPSIVGGTVRLMLDEFGQFSDAEIFGAIRRVHLGIHSEALRNLNGFTADGANDLSVGERQLLCLARAILRKSKLIVIDEATRTAEHAMIINTVRQELAASTVLSIVRRVRNAMDYDRVMVLEAGKLVEFDTPAALLADVTSKFSEMWRAAGEDTLEMAAVAQGRASQSEQRVP